EAGAGHGGGLVRPSLATVLAAVALASAIALGGRAAADDTEPEITSWMLPPSTHPLFGLLETDRVRGSGPPLETADSLTRNGPASGTNMAPRWAATTPRNPPAIRSAATARA